MTEKRVGLIGASSFVGEQVRLLLEGKGYQVVAFSRRGGEGTLPLTRAAEETDKPIKTWFYLAPIWTLPEHFQLFAAHGAKRLIALSSTSRFSKKESPSPSDRALASRLIQGEEEGLKWAGGHRCSLVIFQPTLIYGLGKDKNVTEIARVIERFGFFPILGAATGLRQPVHVDDVASACVAALQLADGKSGSYVLSGREILTYRAMVERVFAGLGRKPRFLRCPLMFFSFVVKLLQFLPFASGPTTEMAVRMNKDQSYDYAAAADELGFSPRAFYPQRSDLVR